MQDRKCCRDSRTHLPVPCPPGFSVTPFGGPASGLWPSGSSFGQATPASCVRASLSADCFRGCSAPSNCGWTTVVGSVIFTGENVVLDPDQGAAVIDKPISTPPLTNTTLQVRFQEISGPVQPTFAYGMGALDAAGRGVPAVQLRGDGTVFVEVAGSTIYSGTWTPQGNGAFHVITLQVGPDAVPRLFIDQVYIPLVLGGAPMPAPFGPAMVFSVVNFGGTPEGAAILWSMFLTTGILSASTIFCCPDGQSP